MLEGPDLLDQRTRERDLLWHYAWESHPGRKTLACSRCEEARVLMRQLAKEFALEQDRLRSVAQQNDQIWARVG
ncbi:MAG: hypothetical protein ACREB9_07445 [Thermoplasmata archaeon]